MKYKLMHMDKEYKFKNTISTQIHTNNSILERLHLETEVI